VGMHHGHPEAPHEDVLRLSNREEHGITRVGPQWHHDGAFERRPFSRVAFRAERMPTNGGAGTQFADVAAAYQALPEHSKQEWRHLASVNAYSGAVHPLVHMHPVSQQPVLFIHLAMTGSVIRWSKGLRNSSSSSAFAVDLEAMEPRIGPRLDGTHTALKEDEVRKLFGQIDELLTKHSTTYTYRCSRHGKGDLVILDNLAVAHRATKEAHDAGHGVRILHRTTMEGTSKLDPPAASHLPPFLYIWGDNPLGGLWQSSDHWGVGFRWDQNLPMFN